MELQQTLEIVLKELSNLKYRDLDILMRLTNKTENVERICNGYGLTRVRAYQIKDDAVTKISEALKKEQGK
jgi:DNA-directed RNA polymerase specialized sigma subunit